AYYRININTTLTLCESMLAHGVSRIIFSSSATVYSGDNQVPLTESSRLGCSNPYGWTKLMNEQILQDIVKANPGFSVVLLRYFNPVGAHPSGLIGEDPQGIPNNLMPYIAKVAVGELKELGVFGNDYPTPDGTGVRDYIHVVDLAKGHVLAMAKFAEPAVYTYNLGTGTGYSVLDIVHGFEEANHLKIPYSIKPRRPGDIAICYADPGKAYRELGWKAEKTLMDMCRDSYEFIKAYHQE
ncbi:MAG: UDP-glucose 4-epimerase GalE, partial [bacterium]